MPESFKNILQYFKGIPESFKNILQFFLKIPEFLENFLEFSSKTAKCPKRAPEITLAFGWVIDEIETNFTAKVLAGYAR